MLPLLAERAAEVDVVTFFTYLYWPTWAGIPVAAAHAPTLVQLTAHDERPFFLPVLDESLRRADGFLCLTPEEAALVRRRFGQRRPVSITGAGTPLDVSGDTATFRARFGLGDRPYILYVGRVDPSKGSVELVEYFAEYKRRNPSDLTLVIVGERVAEVPDRPDLVLTGFVDEATKASAIAGCLALAMPSYYESFSMVVTEAWAHGRPALVQGRCDVLAGQVRRSAGGLSYRGFAEFETALVELEITPGLADGLGRSGRSYVRRHYDWDVVLDRYERAYARASRG